MGALNLPSASDLERLTRRLRGVSQRLEGIEDALDRLEQRLEGVSAATSIDERLSAIEERLGQIEAAVAGTLLGLTLGSRRTPASLWRRSPVALGWRAAS